MRIAILSNGQGWHVLDLIRAAKALGHHAEPLDFRTVFTSLPRGPETLANFDVVIVRTMPPGSLEQVVFRMNVLYTFEARGGIVLNPPRALEICIDKYLACAKLDVAGVPVPKTWVGQDSESAMAAFEDLGRDVVIKPVFGSEGRGMIRVAEEEMAWRTFRTLERLQTILYVQEFVRHPGWDLRAFVVGGQILTGMRRHARGDWRTNVAQGAKAEPVSLTEEETLLALRAAEAVGTMVAGVDLLPRPEGGYCVLEVNAVPGWRALAPTTGVDVAYEMIRYLERHARST